MMYYVTIDYEESNYLKEQSITGTKTVSAHTAIDDSQQAGVYIAEKIREDLNGASPDVVILFTSSSYDYKTLLKAVNDGTKARILVGCSSAGEFTNEIRGESSVSAIALKSDDMAFSASMHKGLSKSIPAAAKKIVSSFSGVDDVDYPYRTALVLADALAGYTDMLIEQINIQTGGTYQLFGGGAGDDAKFTHTEVFLGTESFSDAVVVLEILSKKPVGIGVRHGWTPASEPMRVTEVKGTTVVSLNTIPAVEVIEDYAASTKQEFNRKNPIPFFLHNVLGIVTPQGYKLRVPLAVSEDGSINCASDIPMGSLVCFMKTSSDSAILAAREATKDALLQLNGNEVGGALVFDCVATRLRIGKSFDRELQAISETIPGASFVGCNTYGQVSRVDGQFSGFHNCTAVVCVLPK